MECVFEIISDVSNSKMSYLLGLLADMWEFPNAENHKSLHELLKTNFNIKVQKKDLNYVDKVGQIQNLMKTILEACFSEHDPIICSYIPCRLV